MMNNLHYKKRLLKTQTLFFFKFMYSFFFFIIVGPTDCAVEELARGRDRDERGKRLSSIRLSLLLRVCLLFFLTARTNSDFFPVSQIKVEFSMKFTSRDLSLKRTPSKKQSGVFGVKISVVTKYASQGFSPE